MPTDPNCIFCKIIAGQIPCYKVYEDDVVLAFLDIGPVVRGHTLVVPKEHHATFLGMPPERVGAVYARVGKIAQAVLNATGTKACHYLANSGSDAMQSVHHAHCHIIPRAAGDGFHVPWPVKALDKSDAAEIMASIKAQLA